MVGCTTILEPALALCEIIAVEAVECTCVSFDDPELANHAHSMDVDECSRGAAFACCSPALELDAFSLDSVSDDDASMVKFDDD